MSERVEQSAVDLDELRKLVRGADRVNLPATDLSALLDLAELGAAWARVEAALPEGWAVSRLRHFGDRWIAEAMRWTPFAEAGTERAEAGPTPTAALNALADALSAPVEEG